MTMGAPCANAQGRGGLVVGLFPRNRVFGQKTEACENAAVPSLVWALESPLTLVTTAAWALGQEDLVSWVWVGPYIRSPYKFQCSARVKNRSESLVNPAVAPRSGPPVSHSWWQGVRPGLREGGTPSLESPLVGMLDRDDTPEETVGPDLCSAPFRSFK